MSGTLAASVFTSAADWTMYIESRSHLMALPATPTAGRTLSETDNLRRQVYDLLDPSRQYTGLLFLPFWYAT